ncbi:amidohydrolase family protein [Thermopolyspora sp. NPDC052614]|uniref:amidohydrolase family protein n=1 Tax=Thermopolyspora sp. NPDC052614 TaxID=3155682 RepID=UPI00343E5E51
MFGGIAGLLRGRYGDAKRLDESDPRWKLFALDVLSAAPVFTRRFKATATQVKPARAFVAELLGSGHPRLDDAVLLTSELAGNVVRHAVEREFDVSVSLADGGVLVVRDCGSLKIPRPRNAADDEVGGRGLDLVNALGRLGGAFIGTRSGARWCGFSWGRRAVRLVSDSRRRVECVTSRSCEKYGIATRNRGGKMSQNDLIITGGHVITMDPAVPDGPASVVVRAGRIVDVVPADREIPQAAEVVDATGSVVLPGLVDTHRHTWQSATRHFGLDLNLMDYLQAAFLQLGPAMRPADVHAATLLGALGAIDSGITTLVDWAHIQNTPEHSDAAVAALRESGMRGVFAYGWPQVDPLRWVMDSEAELPGDIRRVRAELADDNARVTMALAARGPEMCRMSAVKRDLDLARELGLRTTMHLSNEGGVRALHEIGVLDETVTLVHACGCGDDELKLAADLGVTASVSPLIEMTMSGLGTPATGRLKAAGVVTGLSVDTEIATSGDLFTQMRAALAQHRQAGHPEPLSARDLLAMATIGGAAVAGLNDRTGSITPGKSADLIVVAADTVATAPVVEPTAATVLAAHPGLVRTVMVEGRLLKHDGVLLAPVRQALDAAADTLAYLRQATQGVFPAATATS